MTSKTTSGENHHSTLGAPLHFAIECHPHIQPPTPLELASELNQPPNTTRHKYQSQATASKRTLATFKVDDDEKSTMAIDIKKIDKNSESASDRSHWRPRCADGVPTTTINLIQHVNKRNHSNIATL